MTTNARVVAGIVSDVGIARSFLPAGGWNLVATVAFALVLFCAVQKLGVVNWGRPRGASNRFLLPGKRGCCQDNDPNKGHNRPLDLCVFSVSSVSLRSQK